MRQRWMVRIGALGAAALVLGVMLGGCSADTSTADPTSAQRTETTIPTPAGAASGGKAGPASLYPSPSLTPGDVFPGVTAKEVCVPGYSSSVRSVSADEKAAVYQRYGIPNEPGKHEVDHLISLELGGSNMVTNLWPEPYVTPDAPNKIGAHEKDTVENYLHAQVCKGAMTLAQAQEEIRTDWYAVYLKIAK